MALCIAAILGVLLLQFYWIKKYYATTLFQFERQANLCFEDAVKKEFAVRCDTVQALLMQQLMDTTKFRITDKYNQKYKRYDYTITSVKDKKDISSFSPLDINTSLLSSDTKLKKKIAETFVLDIRKEDLENHFVYYRLQDLGAFEVSQVEKYAFDTSRLRSILSNFLAKENIHTPFRFYTSANDSTFNIVQLSDSLKRNNAVVTKSLPTYKYMNKNESYVRAIFDNPFSYIIAQMKWIFIGSVLLTILVGACIYLLAKALLREKQLSAMKNDFINNITHEFKTPIATVSAAVEALSDFNATAEKSHRYLDLSKNELQRLNGLVNNILNITLYENGNKTLNKTSVNIKSTINDITHAFALQNGKKIHFTFENHPDHQEINVDKELFYQALRNIIDNSIKYSGDEVDIHVACSQKDNFVTIEITDNGIGISSSALPKIFDKFYREPGNGHSIKGHGLGLSYVKEIVEMHGGSVEIKSTKGNGTTVILKIPV